MVDRALQGRTATPGELYILSGCSGGGKSSLLEKMSARGYRIVPEAGRRVVAEAQSVNSDALPWVSPLSFVRACVSLHLKDLDSLEAGEGPVLLDRSLIDVISYLKFKHLPVPADLEDLLTTPRYEPCVFMTPPWPEIFKNDRERKAAYPEAVKEHDHLCRTFAKLGFTLLEVPKRSIEERADFIKRHLSCMDTGRKTLGTE
nr:AAA family ATPase [Roseibium sp.]